MKTEELLNNNPLSKELIRQWFFNKMTETIDDDIEVPQDFRDAMIKEGISDILLKKHIEVNPRCLFEIFDENELFIDISRKKMQFTFDVNSKQIENKYFMFRKDAETNAIIYTMSLLEYKLNEIKNTNKNG